MDRSLSSRLRLQLRQEKCVLEVPEKSLYRILGTGGNCSFIEQSDSNFTSFYTKPTASIAHVCKVWYATVYRSQSEIQTAICYVRPVDCPSVQTDLRQTYIIYSPGNQSVMYGVCAKSLRTEAETYKKSLYPLN